MANHSTKPSLKTSAADRVRQRRHERRREEILAVAMKVMLRDGLAAMTMTSLAKGLGVAVGGLYRYFASKTHVVAALQVEALNHLTTFNASHFNAVERQIMASEPGDAVKSLVRVVTAPMSYLCHAQESPDWHQLIDQSLSTPTPLLDDQSAAEVSMALEALLQPVAERLEAATTEGHLNQGDAEARTYILWATIHGLDHMRKRDARLRAELRSHALVRGALATLLVGWGAEMTAATAAISVVADALSTPSPGASLLPTEAPHPELASPAPSQLEPRR